MAMMLGKLHAALVSAGVKADAAREAAEEVAAYEHELAEIKATQRLHSWMLTTNTVLLIAILAKLLL
jgi:hypothetical protein